MEMPDSGKRFFHIMGATYTVETNPDIIKREGADGICARYGRKILIAPIDDMLPDCDNDKEKQARFNEVMRHELLHAFLYECGVEKYAEDEDLVQFLAIQFYKLYELFREMEVLV